MSDAFHPFDESELSAEDLAIIQAFDELKWQDEPSSPSVEQFFPTLQDAPADFRQEMLLLFVDEVSEDLSAMVHVRRQLEDAQSLLGEQFVPFRRGGHKIRGSAGAVNCQALSTIAGYIEDISELVIAHQLEAERALHAIRLALVALEETLESVVASGQEDEDPLARLVEPLEELIKKPTASSPSMPLPSPEPVAVLSPLYKPEKELETPLFRVESARIDQLSLHSLQLNELRGSLESSQSQFAQALQELHIAQARLRQLQPALLTLFSNPLRSPIPDEHSSSLIARILAEAEQRDEHGYLVRKPGVGRKLRSIRGSSLWDELEIERYSEQDLLFRSLNEAIADVSLISIRVQSLSAQRDLLLQRYINQAALVHADVRKLRLVPLRVLLPEIRAFIQGLSVQMQTLEFDVQGEHVEVDQTVLDALSLPLLHLFQTCLSDTTISADKSQAQSPRAWFSAQQLNNEVALEIGFSMPVNGGGLDSIRDPLQHLNGTVSLGRNAANGMSFYLRFPRVYGEVHCLLVRVGAERFLISTSHVQRVSDCKREVLHTLYNLGHLLGLPSSTRTDVRIQPVLVLPTGNSPVLIGVEVDEVEDEMELIVKPLPTYLQRTAITRSAVDGKGNVLLLLDLPELIRSSAATQKRRTPVAENEAPVPQPTTPTILIADDSVSMRQSLLQTLSWAHYNVLEARDGIMALELLLEHLPDLLFLDIEMPNLNGYDLLSTMGLYPQLAHVKTIVLTSRSSEKHMEQARNLGAHLYLTKPVAPDVLLTTVKNLLTPS